MGSTMIVVSLLGGLGNQLFQWAYGQALISRGYEVNFNRNSLVEYTHREYSLEEYFDLEMKIISRISCHLYYEEIDYRDYLLHDA